MIALINGYFHTGDDYIILQKAFFNSLITLQRGMMDKCAPLEEYKIVYKAFVAYMLATGSTPMCVVNASVSVYVSVHRSVVFLLQILVTARKRSLAQGSIFTSVCQEFCPQGGGACSGGGVWSKGGLQAHTQGGN